jgi:transcription antitermination factor NusG
MAQSAFALTDTFASPVSSLLYDEVNWYACHTRARHEKKAAACLEERGVESFLPTVERETLWSDRVKRVAFPLFPGYVFGRFTLYELDRVLATRGVVGVVKLRGYPTPVPCGEIENVRRACRVAAETGAETDAEERFPTGTWVRVTSGPFIGLEGIVTEARGGQRVRVGIRAIGRSLDVVVGTATLEPISGPA